VNEQARGHTAFGVASVRILQCYQHLQQMEPFGHDSVFKYDFTPAAFRGQLLCPYCDLAGPGADSLRISLWLSCAYRLCAPIARRA
jgi:hypothetical protein